MTKEILFIGPGCGGGMTAVIQTCCALFPGSEFISSYNGGSPLRKAIEAGKALLRMRRTLKANPGIGIVHIHTASNASFRRKMLFARLARKMGRKVVLHVHGGGFRDFYAKDPANITKALKIADKVVVLSQQWEDFFHGIGIINTAVIPNPVAAPVHVDSADDGLIHFLFLGLLHRDKGVLDLVNVIADNADSWRGRYVFHLAGNGPEEATLRKKIADHGLGDTIILEGWIGSERKAALLSQASALILPSYIEAMPISILEALSYDKPVIATSVGSIPELMGNGEGGILLQPGDTKALAQAIGTMASDPDLRRQMGDNALRLVQPYSTANVALKLQNLYSSL